MKECVLIFTLIISYAEWVSADCQRPDSPSNGRVECMYPFKIGATCKFTCDEGYRLKGASRTTCSSSDFKNDEVWKPRRMPTCEMITCLTQTAPKNGLVNCRSSPKFKDTSLLNSEGSMCTYKCLRNFFLVGERETTCLKTGKWTSDAPKCIQGKCSLKRDKYRSDTCLDGKNFGSVCNFQCKEGFKMLGSPYSICNQIQNEIGKWSPVPPKCRRIICRPIQVNPRNGKVQCSRSNYLNSICTFTCDEGYDLRGTSASKGEVKCTEDFGEDNLGKWTGMKPVCDRIKCAPSLSEPQNGKKECTDSNNYNSVCSLTCNEGYSIPSTKAKIVKSRCVAGKAGNAVGEWTRGENSCKQVVCFRLEAPAHGSMVCSNQNNAGSICSFKCNKEYDIDAIAGSSVESKCSVNPNDHTVGRWDRLAPTCSEIICDDPISGPKNGRMFCSKENLHGSVCTFACDDGYILKGAPTSTCLDLKQHGSRYAKWSSTRPKCEAASCSLPSFDASNVQQDCNTSPNVIGVAVGSSCTYKCLNRGFYMTSYDGNEIILDKTSEIKCNMDTTWSKLPPICLPVKCPEIEAIENGDVPRCTDSNKFGSKCSFTCKDKYVLSHSRPVVCISDGDNDEFGKWNRLSPTCKKNTCDEYAWAKNGKLTCSEGGKLGSVCNLECHDKFIIKESSKTKCIAGEAQPVWSDLYVCCVPCISNPSVRFVFAIDKTSTKIAEDWNQVVDFIMRTLKGIFENGYYINFGLLLFDNSVDLSNDIETIYIDTLDDVDIIIESMKTMPYGGQCKYELISRIKSV